MDRWEKAVLLLLGFLALVPPLLSFSGGVLPEGYVFRVLSSILMMTSLALAQNILLGYTGYPAFGGVAFFGIGAYTAGVLSRDFPVPLLVSVLAGGILSAVVAFLFAPVVMRLKSHYFAIATLALQLALGEMAANIEITGGAEGINLPIYRDFLEGYLFFYLFLALSLFAFGLNLYIERSVFGYALKAIREDELAAESLGVNTVLFKSISFTLMAFVTGLCGGVYAFWVTYIDPTSVFDPILSVKIFVALLLGGVGTTTGPVIGAFLLETVSEVVWSQFLEFHGIILGLLIVLIALLLPKGIRNG